MSAPHRLLLCLLPVAVACSEYDILSKSTDDAPLPDAAAPAITVEPDDWDFGTLEVGETDDVRVTITNEGDEDLKVHKVQFDRSSGDLTLEKHLEDNGDLPWLLGPSDAVEVTVHYAPTDETRDDSTITVLSNDPASPESLALQAGDGRLFEGFSTGWYVWDEGVAYETTSNPSHVIDHHGDPDLYWYEPSGAHGLLDSADPSADFETLRDYVLAHAGAPIPVSGPFNYDADSSLATFEYATFTYFMCDFFLPADADPSRYSISSGTVDDGIQVMVNAEILGTIELGQSGSWPLSNAHPGEVNTLVIFLVDDSMYDKYVQNLAFYEDGVMVGG